MSIAIMNTASTGNLMARSPQVSSSNTGVSANATVASNTRLELTRRGRFIFLGLPALVMAAAAVLVALAIAFGAMAQPARAASTQETTNMNDYAATVTVLQGDSLWSIAAQADPKRDTREVLREIVAMNDLGTGVVQAGQRLFVPLSK